MVIVCVWLLVVFGGGNAGRCYFGWLIWGLGLLCVMCFWYLVGFGFWCFDCVVGLVCTLDFGLGFVICGFLLAARFSVLGLI